MAGTVGESGPEKLASPPRMNNFDLLRLIAALQVVVMHGHEHLGFASDLPFMTGVAMVLEQVPGVPVFYVLSGFLIPWAWTRTPELRTYARNRFLRLYPGLWVALAVSILVMAAQGVFSMASFGQPRLYAWLLAQTTFVQFYTAPELRGYGLGNPNGSLGTITVELQFYLLAPVLFSLTRGRPGWRNLACLVLFLGSIASNVWIGSLDQTLGSTKLLGATLVPYLYNFMLGTALFVNWSRVERWLVGKGLIWLATLAAYCAVCGDWLDLYAPSYWPKSVFHVVWTALIAIALLSLAFTGSRASKVLRGNDLSYGVYLYHAIVLNVLFQHGVRGTAALVSLLVTSVLVAVLSWRWVERPALALKRVTHHSH